jgi:hypothetical protein
MTGVSKRFIQAYYIFLITIVSVLIFNQILVQYSVYIQRDDSITLNISIRQRMISQRFAKAVLFINKNGNKPSKNYNPDRLNSLVDICEKENTKFSDFDNPNENF